MPVRCKACGRSGLPVVPGSIGGVGELGRPVAHVRLTDMHPTTPEQFARGDVPTVGTPCWQGYTREEIIATAEKMAEAIGIVQHANMFRMDL